MNPLRVVERPSGWWLEDSNGKTLAALKDYYEFMRAWMEAPMGQLEVVPLEDTTRPTGSQGA